MKNKSLKTKLLLAIAFIVVLSGLAISHVIMHQYWINLSQSVEAQARSTAHNFSLDAADKILINDLVSLQKLFNDLMMSEPSVKYLFIVMNGKVLAHTFSNGLPEQLLSVNEPAYDNQPHILKIVSENDERFIDVAWPIFSGNYGFLRMGYSEAAYRSQMMRLWVRIYTFTFIILACALAVGFFLIRQITSPLSRLTKTIEHVDEHELSIEFVGKGNDEVSRLADAFRGLLRRLGSYMDRLQKKTMALEEKHKALDRAHQQTRSLFESAKRASALADLKDMCAFLVNKIEQIVTCRQMVVFISTGSNQQLLVYSKKNLQPLADNAAKTAYRVLESCKKMVFYEKSKLPLTLPEFDEANKIAVFPIRNESRFVGAMCIGCPGNCDCVANDLDVLEMILEQTSGAVDRASKHENELRNLRSRIEQTAGFGNLIGKDSQMQIIYKLVEEVAPTDATVLITGESGTGKELVARAIHEKSHRKSKPFVVINCSAYPATLLESELFGHEKGAFTGATIRKSGRFEQADGGTVFLDEIGDIPPSAQVRLLRVLQSRKFERIGGTKTLSVDIRILAATNKNLLEAVKHGEFREDLFYRLHVIPIHLPPLRSRRNDIPLLARHFLDHFNAVQDKGVRDFSSDAMRELLEYGWPGNVRELENTVEHAVILAHNEAIQPADLPAAILDSCETFPVMETDETLSLEETEKVQILSVLSACNWNKQKAALKLGIGRSTLYTKLKKHRIQTLEPENE